MLDWAKSWRRLLLRGKGFPKVSFQMNLLRQLLGLCSGAVIFAALTAAFHPQRLAWSEEALGEGEVSLAEALSWDAEALWVDARTRAQFEADHIPGALLLNEDEWEALLPNFLVRWQPDMKVVVYCDSRQCGASHALADLLRESVGLEEVYILNGGWKTWLESQGDRE